MPKTFTESLSLVIPAGYYVLCPGVPTMPGDFFTSANNPRWIAISATGRLSGYSPTYIRPDKRKI
jgi:hypothetical protein